MCSKRTGSSDLIMPADVYYIAINWMYRTGISEADKAEPLQIASHVSATTVSCFDQYCNDTHDCVHWIVTRAADLCEKHVASSESLSVTIW